MLPFLCLLGIYGRGHRLRSESNIEIRLKITNPFIFVDPVSQYQLPLLQHPSIITVQMRHYILRQRPFIITMDMNLAFKHFIITVLVQRLLCLLLLIAMSPLQWSCKNFLLLVPLVSIIVIKKHIILHTTAKTISLKGAETHGRVQIAAWDKTGKQKTASQKTVHFTIVVGISHKHTRWWPA